jgi:hypothetical protein
MPVQMESIQNAWDDLQDLGLPLARASFEIGWEVAHIAGSLGAAAPADNQPGEAPAPDGTARDASAAYQRLLNPEDLSVGEDVQARVCRIEAGLWYFDNHPVDQIPAGISLSLPIADLKKAVAEGGDSRSTLAQFHLGMVDTCASLDGTIGPGGVPLNGLKEAYEVGRLLCLIVGQASRANSRADLMAVLSVDPGNSPRGKETAAFRAHAMLGGLKGCLPGTAAYSVARHLEDWSSWVAAIPADDTDGTKIAEARIAEARIAEARIAEARIAEARIAIVGQGRVWRAMLSGQALARDYIASASVTDAADRLLANWSASTSTLARAFLRSAIARFLLVLLVIAILVFLGAFAIDLLTSGGATSGAKDGLTITAMLAGLASAAGIFHVSRAQVTSALDNVWNMAESAMLRAELVESIAESTRRLPGDSVTSPTSVRTGRRGRRRLSFGAWRRPRRPRPGLSPGRQMAK